MLSRLGILGAVSGAGIIGVGIYCLYPSPKSSTPSVSEKIFLSSEQQAEYRGRYEGKFPGIDLLAYEDSEAWEEANTRLLQLAHLPKELAYRREDKKDSEALRDWCYSIANQDWEEDTSAEEVINRTVHNSCQVPPAPELKSPSDMEDEGEINLLDE